MCEARQAEKGPDDGTNKGHSKPTACLQVPLAVLMIQQVHGQVPRTSGTRPTHWARIMGKWTGLGGFSVGTFHVLVYTSCSVWSLGH